MLWVIGGILLIVGLAFLIEPMMDIDNMGLGFLAILAWSLLMCVGFALPFVPLLIGDSELDDRYTTYTYEETCYMLDGDFIETKDGYSCVVD